MTMLSIFARLFLLSAMLLPFGCSGADERPPMADFDQEEEEEELLPDGGMDATPGEEPAEEEPVCLDGETQKCSVYLPTQNGVVNCFRGVQVCENGQWGACGDPPSEKVEGQSH